MSIKLTKQVATWYGTLELPKPLPEPGEQVFYYRWGRNSPVMAIVESYTKKDGRFVVELTLKSNGRSVWGYLNQIQY